MTAARDSNVTNIVKFRSPGQRDGPGSDQTSASRSPTLINIPADVLVSTSYRAIQELMAIMSSTLTFYRSLAAAHPDGPEAQQILENIAAAESLIEGLRSHCTAALKAPGQH